MSQSEGEGLLEDHEQAGVDAMQRRVDAFISGDTPLPTNSELNFIDNHPEAYARYRNTLPLYEEKKDRHRHIINSQFFPNKRDSLLREDPHTPLNAFKSLFAELGVDTKELAISTRRTDDPEWEGITYVKDIPTNRQGVILRVTKRPDDLFDMAYDLVRSREADVDYPVMYAGRNEDIYDQYHIGIKDIFLLKDDPTAEIAEDDDRKLGLMPKPKYSPDWVVPVQGEEATMLIEACEEIVNKSDFSFFEFNSFVRHISKLLGKLETTTPNQQKFETDPEFGDSEANLHLEASMRNSDARTECSITANNPYRRSAREETLRWQSDQISPMLTILPEEEIVKVRNGKQEYSSYWLGRSITLAEEGEELDYPYKLPLTNKEVRIACQKFLEVYKQGVEEAKRDAATVAIPDKREVPVSIMEGEERARLEAECETLIQDGPSTTETCDRIAEIMIRLMGGIEEYSTESDYKFGEKAVAELGPGRFLQVERYGVTNYPSATIRITDTRVDPHEPMFGSNRNRIFPGTYYEQLHTRPMPNMPKGKELPLFLALDPMGHQDGIESIFLGRHVGASEFSPISKESQQMFPTNKTQQLSINNSLIAVREQLGNAFKAFKNRELNPPLELPEPTDI